MRSTAYSTHNVFATSVKLNQVLYGSHDTLDRYASEVPSEVPSELGLTALSMNVEGDDIEVEDTLVTEPGMFSPQITPMSRRPAGKSVMPRMPSEVPIEDDYDDEELDTGFDSNIFVKKSTG